MIALSASALRELRLMLKSGDITRNQLHALIGVPEIPLRPDTRRLVIELPGISNADLENVRTIVEDWRRAHP